MVHRMTARFEITTDPIRNQLDVVLSGFFTVDDVRRYHAGVNAATGTLSGLPRDQQMVCDVSEMCIQSQEVVAAFQQVMADPRYRQRRVAFVAASTLARKQVQRVIGARTAAILASRAEALAWLDARAAHAA